jgi:hypothetical protein
MTPECGVNFNALLVIGSIRFVERSRYAAVKTGLLRLRTLHAGGLILHWPLALDPAGCRRLAVHDARQTVNNNL